METLQGKLRWCLIGCGRIAPNHITAMLNNRESVEIAAVCDIIPGKAQQLIEERGLAAYGVHAYEDYRVMIEKEKPDCCSIATDSGYHAEIALYCIRHGIHVIIEKPIAMSLADADEIIEESERMNVRVCTSHQNRFNKCVARTREAIEADRFGKLSHGAVHVRWNRDKAYYDSGDWRGKWASDGGTLMNQCIHGIDLLRWMMGGGIDEVYACTDRLFHDYIEAEDLGLGIVKFKNGSYGLIEGTSNVYPENLEETLYIFGEKGTVKVGGTSTNLLDEWLFSDCTGEESEKIRAENSENPANVYGYGHTRLYADFISAVRTGRAPYVDARAGRDSLELVLAMYKSAAEGRPVKLPLYGVSSADFIGRFDK